MRIRQIKINHWRNFENVELQINDNIGLVCLVGANGTGKSHLLELIAACAHRLGVSVGIEIQRGDPFNDPHHFSLEFFLAKDLNPTIEENLSTDPYFIHWDRTLLLESRHPNGTQVVRAGGIDDVEQGHHFARKVVDCLQRLGSVYFLSLDANRAYPKKNINFNEIAQAYEIDWSETQYTRGRSFRPSATLYDEWMKYFLAQENQAGTRLVQQIRRARESGSEEPSFSDHFDDYKEALQKVLPHLAFVGVDSRKRTLLFDTTEMELSFDQLSGGEREIAFLIGQIDRFALREGLLLIDEPELHLNSDLIRTWISYLVSTVHTGQIWLATHSLEAVEVAGQDATYVLERNEHTRKVDKVISLNNRPVLSLLSRAVGSPAFSISQLRFIFVEGRDDIGERERFSKL